MILYRMLLKAIRDMTCCERPIFQSGIEYIKLKENKGTSEKQENEYYSFWCRGLAWTYVSYMFNINLNLNKRFWKRMHYLL